MTRTLFPLFRSHLEFSHHFWKLLVQKGDTVIDATCGNGHDTLFLASLALKESEGLVYAIDKQLVAIETTKKHIQQHLPEIMSRQIYYEQRCHSSFPEQIKEQSVKLIVYNLGYLPGGDKSLTTNTQTTLESLSAAQKLLLPGGVICMTCYPGHPAGKIEKEILIEKCAAFSPADWCCTYQNWINRQESAGVLLIQKNYSKPTTCL